MQTPRGGRAIEPAAGPSRRAVLAAAMRRRACWVEGHRFKPGGNSSQDLELASAGPAGHRDRDPVALADDAPLLLVEPIVRGRAIR